MRKPVKTRTREGRVRVSTGFPKGTGTGTGILRMVSEKAKKLCYKILKNTDLKKTYLELSKNPSPCKINKQKILVYTRRCGTGLTGTGTGMPKGTKNPTRTRTRRTLTRVPAGYTPTRVHH